MSATHARSTHHPHDRILRADETTTFTGLSRSTIWRLERVGRFPARRRLSAAAVGWMQSELEQWLYDRQAVTTENSIPVAPASRRGRKPKTGVIYERR